MIRSFANDSSTAPRAEPIILSCPKINRTLQHLSIFRETVGSFNMAEVGGYQSLAGFMGPEPGISIYRKFAALNALNLLYMQSELVHLELELKNIAKEDDESQALERKSYKKSFLALQRSEGSVESF